MLIPHKCLKRPLQAIFAKNISLEFGFLENFLYLCIVRLIILCATEEYSDYHLQIAET